MALHDDYARITPVELAFPDPDAAEALFDEVAAEADAKGVDASELGPFMQLDRVGAALRELRAPDVGGEAIHRYAVLFQQAYLFHRAGAPLFVLTAGAVRYLMDGAPASGRPELPAAAGYVQLPRHLFWVDGGDGHAESVDGMFWHGGAGGLLHLLLAQGLRGDRPGLGVVPVAEAPWADAPSWLDATVRPGGDDFASTLPGAEIDGLYGFQAAGEPLKLFARVCAYLDAFPDALEESAGPSAAPAPDEPDRPAAASGAPGDAPPPSRYPYRRIVLDRG